MDELFLIYLNFFKFKRDILSIMRDQYENIEYVYVYVFTFCQVAIEETCISLENYSWK